MGGSHWAALGVAAGAQAALGVAAGAQGETTATPAAHELAASTALAELRFRRAEETGGWEPERQSACAGAPDREGSRDEADFLLGCV